MPIAKINQYLAPCVGNLLVRGSGEIQMTIKRLILTLLTAIVLFVVGLSLLGSWGEPQIKSRLELYQTNLVLHASEWQGEKGEDSSLQTARAALFGADPLKSSQKQYQDVRESVQINLAKATAQLKTLQSRSVTPPAGVEAPLNIDKNSELYSSSEQKRLQESLAQLKDFINELDLKLGVIQAKQGQTDAALKSWQSVIKRNEQPPAKTAAVLAGLWSNPPRILPDAQQWIQKSLDGWFRYQALAQLYTLQQREDALAKLQAQERESAEEAVIKLAIVGALPTISFLIGIVLLLFLLGQRLIKKERSLLSQNENATWSTPWDAETIWQVFVVGFFGTQLLVSILLVPLLFQIFQIDPSDFDIRTRAFSVLVNYLLIALGGVLVLYLSVKSFLPLPEGWFRFKLTDNWIPWGLGGYFVAIPLVIVISLINQQIWQGQGGSNPLLSLALEGKDRVAIAIFFVTAAIAAPLFEEFLFRGFLLPSLTRYMPVWGAIIASSLLFALAHLSLSEVLPLTTLGIVLAVVYTRSRNLLAPILLHSLWNSGTLLSLFILGSGS